MNDNHLDIHGTEASRAAVGRLAAAMPAVFAVVFGLFLVYGTGLAQPNTIHDAAHDARHAFSFPCH